MSISKVRKESILLKMIVSQPLPIRLLSKQEGISEVTLYNWRKQLRQEGCPMPEQRPSETWSSQAKFLVILETAKMTEIELSVYCRSKGLYPEQVKAWKHAAIQSQEPSPAMTPEERQYQREQNKRIKRLETELARKDKALAEAAALLILQKKMRALWAEGEDK